MSGNRARRALPRFSARGPRTVPGQQYRPYLRRVRGRRWRQRLAEDRTSAARGSPPLQPRRRFSSRAEFVVGDGDRDCRGRVIGVPRDRSRSRSIARRHQRPPSTRAPSTTTRFPYSSFDAVTSHHLVTMSQPIISSASNGRGGPE